MGLKAHSFTIALVVSALGSGSQSLAILIELDAISVTNGPVILADDFDNGVLDGLVWPFIVGAPGPEVGTVLQMRGGDIIGSFLNVDPSVHLIASAFLNLADFPAGSYVSLFLQGSEDFLSLSVLADPAIVIFSNSTGVLGAVPFSGTEALLGLAVLADGGGVIATIDTEVKVFAGELSFGPAVGVAIIVVPEPATLSLLGTGLVLVIARRRRRRGSSHRLSATASLVR